MIRARVYPIHPFMMNAAPGRMPPWRVYDIIHW
jgi:hypothetical protein